MPGESQTAEVKLKWTFDGNGVKQVEAMATATKKLTAEEEAYRKKVEETKAAYQKRREELEKLLGAQHHSFEEMRAKTYDDLSKDKTRSEALQRADKATAERIRQGIGVHTLQAYRGPSAPAGGSRGGTGSQLGESLGGLGIGALGAVGLGGGGMALVHGVANLMKNSSAADSHAFQTSAMRDQHLMFGIPGAGDLAATAVRYKYGTAKMKAERDQREFIHQHGMQQQASLLDTLQGMGVNPGNSIQIGDRTDGPAVTDYYKSSRYEAEIGAAKRHDAVHLPSTARGTVEERKRYEEATAMLGTRRNAAKYAAENDKLQEIELQQNSERNRISKKLTNIERDIADKKKELLASYGGDAKQIGSSPADLIELDDIRKLEEQRGAEMERYTAVNRNIMENQNKQVEARAGYASATKGPEYWQAQLGYRQGQEAESQQQARSIGMAGPAARYQSEAALDLIKTHGIEFAPPELIGMASQLHGRETGAMAEKFGATQQKDYKGEGLPGLDAARASTDEAKKNLETTTRDAGVTLATEYQKVLKDAMDLIVQSTVKAMQAKEHADQLKATIQASPLNQ